MTDFHDEYSFHSLEPLSQKGIDALQYLTMRGISKTKTSFKASTRKAGKMRYSGWSQSNTLAKSKNNAR